MRISADRYVWYVAQYYSLLGSTLGNRNTAVVNGEYLDVGKMWMRI